MSAAHVRGLPVALLCGGSIYSNLARHGYLVAAKDSTIRRPKDLAGKRIGLTSIGDLQQAAVMSWIDKGGGDSRQASANDKWLAANGASAARFAAAMRSAAKWANANQKDVLALLAAYTSSTRRRCDNRSPSPSRTSGRLDDRTGH
jgi:ABC-type nitrate/sulfonate/bicarbonate transport system substrate-binding protein